MERRPDRHLEGDLAEAIVKRILAGFRPQRVIHLRGTEHENGYWYWARHPMTGWTDRYDEQMTIEESELFESSALGGG